MTMTRNEKIHKLNVDLINLMMKSFNITYDDIKSNLNTNKQWLIDGKDWFDYYCLSEKEYNIFKDSAIKLIQNVLKISKKSANNEFAWWYINVGLSIK